MAKPIDRLGELQAEAMNVVWDLKEAKVHDVLERIGKRRPLAYTTVLTALQKLEKAGGLAHREEGRQYVYFPVKKRIAAGRGAVGRFLDRVCGGDPVLMFQHLLDEKRLDADELNELRKMIDKQRKEQRDARD